MEWAKALDINKINAWLATRVGQLVSYGVIGLMSLILLGVIVSKWQTIQSLDALNYKPSQTIKRTMPKAQVSISRWHLFGEHEKTVVPTLRTPLILSGIFASSDPALSKAVLAKPGHEEGIFGIGDRLPNGDTLKEIYNNRIVYERNGKLGEILLESATDTPGATSSFSSFTSPNSSSEQLDSERDELEELISQMRSRQNSLQRDNRLSPRAPIN